MKTTKVLLTFPETHPQENFSIPWAFKQIEATEVSLASPRSVLKQSRTSKRCRIVFKHMRLSKTKQAFSTLGTIDIFVRGEETVLCVVGCLAASLGSTH